MTGLFRCASSPCKICWRKPAYCRPPFCGGSNGFLAGSYPHPCAEIKNRPLGDVLFLGRMTGYLRWAINCPTSYCSRVAPVGAAHHSLALACSYVWLVYSYANRGSNPDPSRVIKTPAQGGCFYNWGG